MQESVGKDKRFWEEKVDKQKSKTDEVKKALMRLFKEMRALNEVNVKSWKLPSAKVSKWVDDKRDLRKSYLSK